MKSKLFCLNQEKGETLQMKGQGHEPRNEIQPEGLPKDISNSEKNVAILKEREGGHVESYWQLSLNFC